MATSKNWNNTSFTVPDNGDPRGTWGANLSTFLKALADNALSKYGGSFQLTGADIDFGATYATKQAYLKSRTSNISSTGFLRMANNEGLGWRNAANSADKILKVNASNALEFDGSTLMDSSGKVPSASLNTVAIAQGGTGQTTQTAAFDALSPNTTKGDITARGASNNIRVAVGTDGQVLTADSASSAGLKWTSPLTNPMSAAGDLIVGGASGAATRLAGNTTTARQVLTQTGDGSASATPAWSDDLATSTFNGRVKPRKGQTALTVTCTAAGWAADRAVGIYYQDQDGNHRLKFNISGSITSKTLAGADYFTISGVTFKNVTGWFQSGSAWNNGSKPTSSSACSPNTGFVSIYADSSTTVTRIAASGDMELDSKPSWA